MAIKWIFGPPSTSPTPVSPPPEVIPVVTGADEKHFGLENFGNTCYANSVLQALYFCGPFRDLIVQYPDPSIPDVVLPPPTVPLPPPVSSPPPTHSRPKSSRKPSVDSPHLHNPSSCAPVSPGVSSALPIPSSPPTLLSALRSLYIHISQNPADKGTVAPRAFIDKLKELNELFRSTMHQDAHEFLNYLLNQIVEEIDEDRKRASGNGSARTSPSGEDLSTSVTSLASSTVPPPSATSVFNSQSLNFNSTLVHRLFEGTLTSETRCLTCETVSSRDESFLDLSIDIEQNSSVTACLRQFSASEMLCQKNKFFCDSCCDLQEAEKRMKIKKLPNILALHLKRFKYQEDVGKYIKLTYRVAFPFELRLFNTVDDAENPDRLYELFAVVVHIGNGPHHGHYVSLVKARGVWYLFDDDTVEPIKESEIPKYFGESNAGSAYVLYYQAVDLDVTALGLRPSPPITTPSVHPTESPAVSQSASLPSTAEQPEADLASPAVPPGLADAVGISSSSSSPPTFTSPFGSSSSQPAAQPPLSLQIPIPPSVVEPSSTSPVTPGGSSSRGFLGSLRHSPSLSARMRSANGSGSEQRKSVPPVPPIPIPSNPGSSRQADPSSSSEMTNTPMSPAALYGAPPISRNGKEKEKSSTGTWFKRKSLRADKPPSSMPLAERSTSLGGAGVEDNNTRWYKSKRVMRRASEAGLTDHPTNHTLASSMPDPSTIPHTPSMSPALRPVPEHKKSTPELTLLERSDMRSHRHRPATADASLSRPTSVASPPLPPMPSSPLSNGQVSATPDDDPHAKRHDGRLNGHWHTHQRPHTSHSPVSPSSLGFSTSNGTSSTLSTNAGESASSGSITGALKPKRATRKLSLTAPMLGFGRKEKDKRPQSPATQYTSRDR